MRVRRRLLGHEMAMVYQDALSSLNPAMTIRASWKQLVRRAEGRPPRSCSLWSVSTPNAPCAATPTELGAQRQRVLIAMALSRGPENGSWRTSRPRPWT